MKTYQLPRIAFEAYMAGLYKADRERYIYDARRESGEMRRFLTKTAKQCHRNYLRHLRRAFGEDVSVVTP